jgi:hypothetical protein
LRTGGSDFTDDHLALLRPHLQSEARTPQVQPLAARQRILRDVATRYTKASA